MLAALVSSVPAVIVTVAPVAARPKVIVFVLAFMTRIPNEGVMSTVEVSVIVTVEVESV